MKWYGRIGYATATEKTPGVWVDTIEVRYYTGDIIRNNRIFSNSNSVNGEIKVSNQISVLSDPYIIDNFYNIRYAEFMGTLFCVTNVEVQYPRLLLTLGGVYNGEQA
jgi:hypothetical protein